jgi:hypothetical protein
MKWEVAWSIAFLFNLFLLLLLQWWRKQTRKKKFFFFLLYSISSNLSSYFIFHRFSLYFFPLYHASFATAATFLSSLLYFIPLCFSQSTSLNLIYFNSWKWTTHNSFLYISTMYVYFSLSLCKVPKHNLYLYIIIFVCINIYISST